MTAEPSSFHHLKKAVADAEGALRSPPGEGEVERVMPLIEYLDEDGRRKKWRVVSELRVREPDLYNRFGNEPFLADAIVSLVSEANGEIDWGGLGRRYRAAGGRFFSCWLLLGAAGQHVATRFLVDQPHLLCLLEPAEAVADRAGGPLDPMGDLGRADRQLALVLFHVADDEAVELAGAKPLVWLAFTARFPSGGFRPARALLLVAAHRNLLLSMRPTAVALQWATVLIAARP